MHIVYDTRILLTNFLSKIHLSRLYFCPVISPHTTCHFRFGLQQLQRIFVTVFLISSNTSMQTAGGERGRGRRTIRHWGIVQKLGQYLCLLEADELWSYSFEPHIYITLWFSAHPQLCVLKKTWDSERKHVFLLHHACMQLLCMTWRCYPTYVTGRCNRLS